MTNLAISLISGLLSALAFYHSRFSFLVWFSFVPLFWLLFFSKRPLRYFYIAGLTHFLMIIFWLGFVTRLGLFILVFYLASYWFLFAAGARFLLKRKGSFLTVPSLWVVLEYVREHMFVFGFGWALLGYSQYKNLYLIQAADLFGTKFISFLIITVNLILFAIYRRKDMRQKSLLYGCLLLAFCFLYSHYRLATLAATSHIPLHVMQPNIPQELKWDPRAKEFIIERLYALGESTEEKALIIYPESSWPLILYSDEVPEALDFARSLKRNIILGAIHNDKGIFYNEALFITKEGIMRGQYQKIRLVPFGEYVPLRSLLGSVDILSRLGDITRGNTMSVFTYDEKRFGIIICFEDIFPLFVSRFARNTDFLINITNDAWFYGEPESTQHFSVLVMRAIENRISIARAANTGISGYVDFLGNTGMFASEGSTVFVEGDYFFSLPLNSRRSIYNKINGWFVGFCMVSVVVVPVRARRQRKSNA